MNYITQILIADTDSIVTNIELDKDMVNSNELGKLKLEHKVDKGIFISGKLYWLSNSLGEVIVRAKGIKSTSITYFDYIKLLNKPISEIVNYTRFYLSEWRIEVFKRISLRVKLLIFKSYYR